MAKNKCTIQNGVVEDKVFLEKGHRKIEYSSKICKCSTGGWDSMSSREVWLSIIA